MAQLGSTGVSTFGGETEAGRGRPTWRSPEHYFEKFLLPVAAELERVLSPTGEVWASGTLPQTYVAALRALADQVEARERAEGWARALEPAATSWNELARSTGNDSLRQPALILNQSPSIDIGQNRLMRVLVEFGSLPSPRRGPSGRVGRSRRPPPKRDKRRLGDPNAAVDLIVRYRPTPRQTAKGSAGHEKTVTSRAVMTDAPPHRCRQAPAD